MGSKLTIGGWPVPTPDLLEQRQRALVSNHGQLRLLLVDAEGRVQSLKDEILQVEGRILEVGDLLNRKPDEGPADEEPTVGESGPEVVTPQTPCVVVPFTKPEDNT
jgi:hypothetical protein